MTDDQKKGTAPRPAKAVPPRPVAPPARPSGDRHAAVVEVASLVEEEVALVEEISVSPPGSPAAAPSPEAAPAVPAPVAPPPVPPPVAAAPPPATSAPPVVQEVAPLFGAPPAGTDSEVRRTSKRFPFEINVDIVSEHNFYAGLSLNISEGGLFVATHVEYPVGTKLEIRLLLPGDEEPTAIMTEVRWVRPHNENADGSAGMGLRFLDMAPTVMAKIHRFAQNRDPLYYEDD